VIALAWRWLLPVGSDVAGWHDRRACTLAVLAGLLINALYLGLAYHAMAHLSAGLTSILVSTSPLLTAALAWWWLGERFGWRGALGLVGALGGVMWIMAGRSAGDSSLLGIVMVLAGACCLALATLLNRRLSGRLHPWRIALLQLGAAGLVLLPLAWWREGLRVVPDPAWVASLLYQVLVSSIVTTLLLLWLIRHGGAARASSFHLLNPFFGTVLGICLLGEALPWSDLLGALPIVGGLALVLRPVRKGA
jgi:drug/metabolite transporter (DMT)-like permease